MSLTLPAHGEVHIRQISLDHAPVHPGLLSEDELARAGRFHFAQDARRWTASRSELREILGAYLGVSPAQLQFESGPWGKPRLPDCPLRFNISHSGGMALLAFAWQQEVGVDIESRRADFSPLELAPLIFSAAEQAWLTGFGEDQQYHAFLTLWTAKEAYIKARGEGLSFPLPELTLTPVSKSDRFQVEDLASDGTRPSISVCRLSPGHEYLAALALEGPLTDVHFLDHSCACLSYVSSN